MFGFDKLTAIESLLAVLRIFEANYPECLRTCTVVNGKLTETVNRKILLKL